MGMNEVFRLRSDVRFRTVLDEGVVVCQDAAEVLVLNEVGARILELTDGEMEVEEIYCRLKREFSAPEDDIRRDLESFLADLSEAGVIERSMQKAEES